MAQRKIFFANDHYYHIFNVGVDRRDMFTTIRDCKRAQELLSFYQHEDVPIRFSQYLKLPLETRLHIKERVMASETMVNIVAHCLMPNHFHLLIKQNNENGIARFLSNFINAYTKYFNIKYKRLGPLFQGVFKAVHIETDEQLLHVTRYININPVTAGIIPFDQLSRYSWSSYPLYISQVNDYITCLEEVRKITDLISDYSTFCSDQVDYAKKLHAIKHLVFED